jgi:hypothetical protein
LERLGTKNEYFQCLNPHKKKKKKTNVKPSQKDKIKTAFLKSKKGEDVGNSQPPPKKKRPEKDQMFTFFL